MRQPAGRCLRSQLKDSFWRSDLHFRSLSAAKLDAHAAYDLKARHARVASARLQAPWGRVSANGELPLDRERRSRMRAELSGVDVAVVRRALTLPYVAGKIAPGQEVRHLSRRKQRAALGNNWEQKRPNTKKTG